MEEQDSREFIYRVTKEKVDTTFQDIEHLETKAGILIAFNGVIISLALRDIFEQTYLPLLIVAVFFFLLALILNFMSIRCKTYRKDPNPRKLMEGYWNKPKKEITEQLIANLVECYEYNERRASITAYQINLSIFITLAGLSFLIASVLKN